MLAGFAGSLVQVLVGVEAKKGHPALTGSDSTGEAQVSFIDRCPFTEGGVPFVRPASSPFRLSLRSTHMNRREQDSSLSSLSLSLLSLSSLSLWDRSAVLLTLLAPSCGAVVRAEA